MGLLGNFFLLLWKDFTIERRHPCRCIFEFAGPLVLAGFIMAIRMFIGILEFEDKYFDDYNITENTTGADLYDRSILAYSPYNVEIDAIIKRTAGALNKSVISFADNKTLTEYFLNESALQTVFAGVQFEDDLAGDMPIPDQVTVYLRFPDVWESPLETWETNKLFEQKLLALPRPEDAKPDYLGTGFLYLQQMLSFNIIEHFKQMPEIEIYMERFPYPSWKSDVFSELVISQMLFFLLYLAYSIICLGAVKTIAVEKEKQLKETLKIYGVSNVTQWSAFFARIFLMFFLLLLITTALFKIPLRGFAVFNSSSASVLLVLFMLYSAASTTFCFVISACCPQANLAGTTALLAWLFTAILHTMTQTKNDSIQLLVCIFSNAALGKSLAIIGALENLGVGAQWSNLWSKSSTKNGLTMGHMLLFLTLDAVLYMLIALYIEAVFPGQYGTAKVWYFPFTKSFWRGRGRSRAITPDEPAAGDGFVKDFHETEPNLPVGIRIVHLRKVYGKKVAVRDLSLNMFEGQITALLGHNGAGKTTTINMLTKMIPPTSGTAYINDCNISDYQSGIKGQVGFCPQHNILFEDLTVKEHIYLFCKLKGVEAKLIPKEIDDFLKLLDLQDKAKKKSSTLSGGMKRKLSIGIALCGSSSAILLDEPTAGMDPIARRMLWDLLLKQKKNRTILLTTHFMDEADLLGDRIAILSEGKLKCSGSSFFLKKKFGSGYHLIIAKAPGCRTDKIQAFLRKHIANIVVNSDIGSELRFVLKQEDVNRFEGMFRDLEKNNEELKIDSFGVTLPTIEEVFMKMGSEEEVKETHPDNDEIIVSPLKGWRLIWNQFIAMFMKKGLLFLRSWLFIVSHILIAFLILALVSYTTGSQKTESPIPPLKISLETYDSSTTVVSGDSPLKEAYMHYVRGTNQRVEDIETESFSNYILNKTTQDPSTVQLEYIVGASFYDNSVKAWFNGEPLHSQPLALSLIMNALMYNSTNSTGHSITVVNHPLPMPFDKVQKLKNIATDTTTVLSVFSLMLNVCSAIFIIFIIRERSTNAKHQQLVSGVNTFVYWSTTLLCDWILFVAISAVFLAVFPISGNKFYSSQIISLIYLSTVYFGFCSINFCYIFSSLFKIPVSGYIYQVIINFFGESLYGFVVVARIANLTSAANIMNGIFVFVPGYSLKQAVTILMEERNIENNCEESVVECITYGDQSKEFCETLICTHLKMCCDSGNYLSWGERGISINLVILTVMGLIFFLFLLIIDSGLLAKMLYICSRPKRSSSSVDDEDVIDERNRTLSLRKDEMERYTLVMKNVSKQYGILTQFQAVNDTCLRVKGFECFGLLGVNGAGKTTTFKMLTGDILVSSGDIWIKGMNIKNNRSKVYKVIGYCPQFDALFNDLTGKETLIIYALIKGIPLSKAKSVADQISKRFDFHRHLNKQVHEYSGGNKRKLNASLAFIGEPDIIFLDEPTAGMDPATKRHFWNALCRARDRGKCIILTSHSMEECEALCTKIAIMVKGNIKCLGSIQHLKSKFAKGFTLMLKITRRSSKTDVIQADHNRVAEFVKSNFPTAELQEQYQDMFVYQITGDKSLSWSNIFGIIENNKKALHIEDYSVTQSSLERVFLSFS